MQKKKELEHESFHTSGFPFRFQFFFEDLFLEQKKTDTLISGENELLTDEIRRIENALQSTDGPMHIGRDCLANRQRRIDSDLVQDDAEKALLKVTLCQI